MKNIYLTEITINDNIVTMHVLHDDGISERCNVISHERCR